MSDNLYPITDRLRCQYMGRDFSGKMEVELPTAIMLEAAERIIELESQLLEADSLFNERELAWEVLHRCIPDLDELSLDLPSSIAELGAERDKYKDKYLGLVTTVLMDYKAEEDRHDP